MQCVYISARQDSVATSQTDRFPPQCLDCCCSQAASKLTLNLEMAFGQEAAEQLWQELVRGYNLNAKLLALLMQPLDTRGQKAASAMSQELSRVFMVSLFTLKPGDISKVLEVRRAAPEATNTEGTIVQRSPAKNKRIWYSTNLLIILIYIS